MTQHAFRGRHGFVIKRRIEEARWEIGTQGTAHLRTSAHWESTVPAAALPTAALPTAALPTNDAAYLRATPGGPSTARTAALGSAARQSTGKPATRKPATGRPAALSSAVPSSERAPVHAARLSHPGTGRLDPPGNRPRRDRGRLARPKILIDPLCPAFRLEIEYL